MSFYTTQKQLAVKPIQRLGIKHSIVNGIAMMTHKKETVTVELLFDAMIDNEFILKGSKVVFLGDAEARPWNAQPVTHEGVEFVLAPYTEAIMIKAPEGI